MAELRELNIPLENNVIVRSSGIKIRYSKIRDTIEISGYYDNMAGIESAEISVKDFCAKLGIDLKKKR